ncbi:hypothetical protein [Bradyrhizobium liaoningense]|uniref:hypothetical protein n=1 Tax=Bradyrhizobium liaoningense TaxID=43992 RepID=UPI001BA96F97|nr:hypothetical protein [Bradyrhizobium liaoningense]MBR0856902.1 hypothetical protein [Bradyrhizobium liaoningense]
MGIPKDGTISVRITCVGHASRRWRSARTKAAASALNQRLSELRAKTIYDQVDPIVKMQLPGLPIALGQRAVGSTEPFPTVSEDNAAIDRSVVLMVDLVWTGTGGYKKVPRPPRLIYAPSTLWELKIAALFGASGIGFKSSLLRVKIKNLNTGRELSLFGPIFGGDLTIGPGMFKKVPKVKPVNFDKVDPKQLRDAQVGKPVVFTTPLMDFEDWINGSEGQLVRLVHAHLKTGVTKSQTSFLQFVGVDTHPGSLVFDLKALGFSLGIPEVSDQVQAGKLTAENHPTDMYLVDTPDDTIPIQVAQHRSEGILISFPTEKHQWKDLSSSQQDEVRRFVLNRTAAIRALADFKDVVAPTP